MRKVILTDPEWDWEATYSVNFSIDKLLYEEYGVRSDSVVVVEAACPRICVQVPCDFTFMIALRYRNVDREGVRAWLWRALGKMFGKLRWVRKGQDAIMLEPPDSPEVEEIQLSQCVAEGPFGERCMWWMGYGPKSRYLAIGAWKGSTDFAQSGAGKDE